VAFSSNGGRLATAGSDGTAKIWDALTGELMRTLSGHSGAVRAVAFSPDGTRLATASEDKTAKLWDAASGQVLRTLLGHTSTVHSVAFSPDGLLLATASVDRTAHVITLTSLSELFVGGQNQAARLLNREECAQYLRGRPCLMMNDE
jgi:WD40 repeat protein